jgi:hypothetical protein
MQHEISPPSHTNSPFHGCDGAADPDDCDKRGSPDDYFVLLQRLLRLNIQRLRKSLAIRTLIHSILVGDIAAITHDTVLGTLPGSNMSHLRRRSDLVWSSRCPEILFTS